MRAIPGIFAAVIGGVCYADAMGWIDGPASLMHPKSRSHIQKVEIDLSDAPRAGPDLPPAVIDRNIEWLADIKRATETGQIGEDEEKRLFWHTVWGDNTGVPFTGWGDPDPLNYTVWTATHSPDNPGFHFVYDDPPVRHSEQAPEVTPPPPAPEIHLPVLAGKKPLSPVFDKDDGKDNSESKIDPPVLQALCLVDPALPQCIAAITPDPTDPTTPPVVTVPTGPTGPTAPTGPVITGPVVPVNPITAGNVPEPSTWAMMVLGFVGLAFMAYLKQRRLTATGHTQSCQA